MLSPTLGVTLAVPVKTPNAGHTVVHRNDNKAISLIVNQRPSRALLDEYGHVYYKAWDYLSG